MRGSEDVYIKPNTYLCFETYSYSKCVILDLTELHMSLEDNSSSDKYDLFKLCVECCIKYIDHCKNDYINALINKVLNELSDIPYSWCYKHINQMTINYIRNTIEQIVFNYRHILVSVYTPHRWLQTNNYVKLALVL